MPAHHAVKLTGTLGTLIAIAAAIYGWSAITSPERSKPTPAAVEKAISPGLQSKFNEQDLVLDSIDCVVASDSRATCAAQVSTFDQLDEFGTPTETEAVAVEVTIGDDGRMIWKTG